MEVFGVSEEELEVKVGRGWGGGGKSKLGGFVVVFSSF